jgi:hypothetical protein
MQVSNSQTKQKINREKNTMFYATIRFPPSVAQSSACRRAGGCSSHAGKSWLKQSLTFFISFGDQGCEFIQ